MDANFWVARWEKGETGFHQAGGNDLLVKHWPALKLSAGQKVFVPLCGKSVDMTWLATQDLDVVGSELSRLAVSQYFEEQGVTPEVGREGAFEVSAHGKVAIWCGDFFALPSSATRDVAAVYDRAALIAMPPALQRAYVETLTALAGRAPILLIAITYPEGQIAGPPFATPYAQVRQLFAGTHEIEVREERDGLAASPNLRERGVTQLIETVYLLRPRL